MPIAGTRLDAAALRNVRVRCELLQALAAALPPGDGGAAVLAALHRALGEAFGAAARAISGSEQVDFVASHGQTVWHDGPRRVTLQLGDAFAIREAVGATVCYDFRSADCAAGGQGAPLVAYVDAILLGDDGEDRVGAQSRRYRQRHALAKGTRFGRGRIRHGSGTCLSTRSCASQRGRAGDRPRRRRWPRAGTRRRSVARIHARRRILRADARPKRAGGNDSARTFSPGTASGWRDYRLEDGLATLTELTAASVASAIEASDLMRGTIDRKRRRRAQSAPRRADRRTASACAGRNVRRDGHSGGSERSDRVCRARLRNAARAARERAGSDRSRTVGARWARSHPTI